MIVGKHYSDLVALHRSLVLLLASSPRHGGVLDDVRGSAGISFTNLVFAKSCDFERFDLGWAGFTNSRWSLFLKQYIDSEDFHSWIRQAPQVKKNGAETVFLAKQIGRKEKVTLNATSNHLYSGSHRYSNCLLGLTFGWKPKPLIMAYSRTSALTKGGVLDLTLASIAARELAKIMGVKQSEIGFAWASASLQCSTWQLLCLGAAWGLTAKIQQWDTPVGHGFNRYVVRGRDYTYQSSLRQQEKADRITAGTMPECLVSSLSVPTI